MFHLLEFGPIIYKYIPVQIFGHWTGQAKELHSVFLSTNLQSWQLTDLPPATAYQNEVGCHGMTDRRALLSHDHHISRRGFFC
jgi:hypothetical protein